MKTSKKAVLLNDTSYENHHGCNKVIQNIRLNLIQQGIELIATLPIGQNWKENKTFLNSLDVCDLVIINGEGTIHHNSKYGLSLLKIVDYINKPIVLMNMIYQDNSEEYIELIRKFTQVYVRESKSQEELSYYGIVSKVIPDMTFYSTYKEKSTKNRKCLCITDSHDIKLSERLYWFSKELDILFMPIIAPYKKFSSMKGFIKKIKYGMCTRYRTSLFKTFPVKYSYSRYQYVSEESEYLSKLSSCQLLVSARFHAIYFAIQMKIPFIAIRSNTHKIEGLLYDIGLDESRIITDSSVSKLNFDKYQFTEDEILKIDMYLDRARNKIENMFVRIRSLLP